MSRIVPLKKISMISMFITAFASGSSFAAILSAIRESDVFSAVAFAICSVLSATLFFGVEKLNEKI